MAYNPTIWNPGGPPGISAARLNNIEQGIKAAHDEKFDKAGGTITGNVIIDNAQLQFRDGTATKKVIHTWGGDSTGLGVAFGGGGATVVYGGEADLKILPNNNPTGENVYVGADSNVYFYSNLQNDWNSRHEMVWRNNGNLEIGGNVVHHAGNSPTAFVIPIFQGSPYATFYMPAGATSSFVLSFPSVLETLHTATYAITWDPSFARGRNLQYEVSMWVSAGTGQFRLYWSGGETSTVTTSSTTPVRLRSGNISLPSGVPIYFGVESTVSGSTIYIAFVRLIIS